MKKTQIPIIAIAMFGISLLLGFEYVIIAYATETTIYNQTGTATALAIGTNATSLLVGEEIESTSVLKNDWFNKITVRMYKTGSPTGTVFIGIWLDTAVPTDSNYAHLLGSIPATELTTSSASYNFTFSNTTITENDVIGVFYDTGSSGNTVNVNYGGNAFNGSSTQSARYRPNDGGWINDGFDVSFTLWQISNQAEEACIDTNLDGEIDLCFVDTNNDGVADNGLGGSLGAFNSNANVTQLGQTWFCAFNIGDACTNDDAETNGVGVFYLLIIILFSYAFIVSIHIMAIKASKGNVGGTQALMIHPILLLVMLFIDVALSWYLNFIPDVIFYSILVLMVGLGGFGIYRIVTKDN